MPDRPRTRRKWLLRLTAICGSLALTAGLLELGVRLFAEEVPKFPRAVVAGDFGLRINLPGAHYRHKSADVTVWFDINSRGLRDTREFPYEKPPGKRRIVCLGDSFTMGYEVAAEDTFASVLERELEARGHDVDVLNAGVSGFSNAEECLYLEREMIRYDPDVVIVSYYVNDPQDNVRTGLFGLTPEGELTQLADEYVPLGTLGNFLNENPVFLWLSQYSEAFALLKERGTTLLKEKIEEENLETLQPLAAPATPESAGEDRRPKRRRRLLVARIFDRIYDFCHARGIPLVVQSIPAEHLPPEGSGDEPRLIDTFPWPLYFDLDRPGLYYLSAKELLEPYLGREQLYWHRSHRHWTPFSHARSGEALARLIEEERLLEAPAD